MASPVPTPPSSEEPAKDLLSSIPVFETFVGTAVFLAVAGVALAVVPALRRRRALVAAWVLIVGAFSLVVLVNVVRLWSEFS